MNVECGVRPLQHDFEQVTLTPLPFQLSHVEKEIKEIYLAWNGEPAMSYWVQVSVEQTPAIIITLVTTTLLSQ